MYCTVECKSRVTGFYYKSIKLH